MWWMWLRPLALGPAPKRPLGHVFDEEEEELIFRNRIPILIRLPPAKPLKFGLFRPVREHGVFRPHGPYNPEYVLGVGPELGVVPYGAFDAFVAEMAEIHRPWPGRSLIHGRFRGYGHFNRRQRGRLRLWLTALSLGWPHLCSVRTYVRTYGRTEEGEGAFLIYIYIQGPESPYSP